MRVLWLSPWLRTLSRVQIDALTAQGHQCLLVTTDQHYEAVAPRSDERVLDPRIKDPRNLLPLLRVWREAKAWKPDVVVYELVHDPRWLVFRRLAPTVHVVHDHQPHDVTEEAPRYREAVLDHLTRRCTAVVGPSRFVAGAVSAAFGRPVDVVPVTSDVADAALPPVPVPAAQRRDVVLLGRMSPYKNIPRTLDAWAAHTRSDAYRGDRLLLLGDGPAVDGRALPPHTEWRREHFAYRDVLPVIARAKASIVHYGLATQSGVQVLSMQLGVAPVISDSGGLPEFAPPHCPPIGVDDTAGLTDAFDALADPATAVARGEQARAHYLATFSADRAAATWSALFERLTGVGHPVTVH